MEIAQLPSRAGDFPQSRAFSMGLQMSLSIIIEIVLAIQLLIHQQMWEQQTTDTDVVLPLRISNERVH